MGFVSGLRRKDPLLAGKKNIIVGAAGGVGSVIARVFHREGARLLLMGRNREKLEGFAQELGEGHLVQMLDPRQVDRRQNPETHEPLRLVLPCSEG